ncbi:hypothetical protein AB0O18_00970 [Streptomyces sp. NPDC093224]|uniref:hypothetical protein n=1 Tax=Streptomyces sp. NPDC093224 TaxID=3155198 RepID=UPI0034206239
MKEIRRTSFFRDHLPMESYLAWPVPVRRRDVSGTSATYLRFAVFSGSPAPGGGVLVRPPFATITVARATGRLTEYSDLRFSRPWPGAGESAPVGRFPDERLRTTVGEYNALRHRLLCGYDELLDTLEQDRTLPARTAAEFSELLALLIEPGLEPYLRAIGPAFFTRFLGPGPSAADPQPSEHR